MRVRHIKTKSIPLLDENKRTVVKDGKAVMQTVPELDAAGNEIEVYSIEIPQEIEHDGGAAIDAYVTEQLAKSRSVVTPASTPTTKTEEK